MSYSTMVNAAGTVPRTLREFREEPLLLVVVFRGLRGISWFS